MFHDTNNKKYSLTSGYDASEQPGTSVLEWKKTTFNGNPLNTFFEVFGRTLARFAYAAVMVLPFCVLQPDKLKYEKFCLSFCNSCNFVCLITSEDGKEVFLSIKHCQIAEKRSYNCVNKVLI